MSLIESQPVSPGGTEEPLAEGDKEEEGGLLESVENVYYQIVDSYRSEPSAGGGSPTKTVSLVRRQRQAIKEAKSLAQEAFMQSELSVHGNLICAHCKENFETSKELKVHYKRFHKEWMDYNYSETKRRNRKLNRHLCDKCEKHFGDAWTLKHHQKTVHMSLREHHCPECSKSFLSNKDMRRHHKAVHLGQKVVYKNRQKRKRGLSEKSDEEPDAKVKEVKEEEVILPLDPNLLIKLTGVKPENKENSSGAARRDKTKEQTAVPVASGRTAVGSGEQDGQTLCNVKIVVGSKADTADSADENVTIFPPVLVQKLSGSRDKSPELAEVNVEEANCDSGTAKEADPIGQTNKDPLSFPESFHEQIKLHLDPDNDEPPIFRLENLENLQFVVPEDTGEPQIIIPENGIKLTIPMTGEKSSNQLVDIIDKLPDLPANHVLTIVPEGNLSALPADNFAGDPLQTVPPPTTKAGGGEEHGGELPAGPYGAPYELPLELDSIMSKGLLEDFEGGFKKAPQESCPVAAKPSKESVPIQAIVPNDYLGKPKLISKLEFNSEDTAKKFIYKKVRIDSSAHLVAVKEISDKGIVNLSPESPMRAFKIDRTYKCGKCDKFFISKAFLDKHVKQLHPVISMELGVVPTTVSHAQLDTGESRVPDTPADDDLDDFVDVSVDVNIETLSDDQDQEKEEEEERPDAVAWLASSPKRPAGRRQCDKYECHRCGMEFAGKSPRHALARHKRTVHAGHKRTYKCDECSATFTSRHAWKGHVSSVHEGIKKVCPDCHRPVADLTRHIRLQHKKKDVRRFPCAECRHVFRTLYSLQRHKETVHLKLKNWPCDLCEKTFGEKRDMVRHKTAVHYGIKKAAKLWRCPECDVTFRLRREFDQHKTSVHPHLSEEQLIKFLNAELETKSNHLRVNTVKVSD